MTIAVCFNCGEFKHGAFKPCPICGALPSNKDELSLSMALTDHYFNNDGLEEIRKNIQKGISINLPDEVKENFQKLIQESGIDQMIRAVKEEIEKDVRIPPETHLSTPSIERTYLHMAEAAFEIAHEFVDLRELINKEAGTFWSFIRNLFRTVDYQHFVDRTHTIKDKLNKLQNEIEHAPSDKDFTEEDFTVALQEYLGSLSISADILLSKTDFLARKARSAKAPGTSYAEFQTVIKDEWASLQECQKTGDRLTELYRSNL